MTNATAKTAAAAAKDAAPKKQTRKVLREEDIKIGNVPTSKALKAELEAELRKTGAPRAAELARGVKAKDAPQSVKALADKAAAAKGANKADAALATKAAKVTAKAKQAERAKAKAAERQSWTGDRPYKVIADKAAIVTRPGTWTEVMIQIALKHNTTAKANAELAKHREYGDRKIDWKWLASVRQYIQFTD